MLAATLIYLDRFHTHAATGITWIVVYVATPIAMAVLLALQVRVAGGKLPRLAAMSAVARAVFASPGGGLDARDRRRAWV